MATKERRRKEGIELRKKNAKYLESIKKYQEDMLEHMEELHIPKKFMAEIERMEIKLN